LIISRGTGLVGRVFVLLQATTAKSTKEARKLKGEECMNVPVERVPTEPKGIKKRRESVRVGNACSKPNEPTEHEHQSHSYKRRIDNISIRQQATPASIQQLLEVK
jgi:hypothetical protein